MHLQERKTFMFFDTCATFKKNNRHLNVIKCVQKNNRAKPGPFWQYSTHRWHSPACRIKSSLFLALMVNSCSEELKTSRRRWHCRVLFRWREKKKSNFSDDIIVCLSKLVFIHGYKYIYKQYMHSHRGFISSSNCKNILILQKQPF